MNVKMARVEVDGEEGGMKWKKEQIGWSEADGHCSVVGGISSPAN